MAEHGLGMLGVGCWIEVHDVDRGSGHVVDVKKFPHGRSRTPDDDFRGIAFFRFVETTDQCRNDVRVLRVIIVPRAIEVSRHNTAVVDTMALTILAVVAFAEFDASDFGNGVGFVGGFQNAGEQGLFAHGLGGKLGIDTARTQKE